MLIFAFYFILLFRFSAGAVAAVVAATAAANDVWYVNAIIAGCVCVCKLWVASVAAASVFSIRDYFRVYCFLFFVFLLR